MGENRDKVEKQAGKAQEYLELKKERDSLAKGIYQCEYNNKNSELDKSNQSKENLDSENNKLQTEFEEIENRLEIIDLKEKIELKKYIEENGNKNQELKREIESKEKEKVRISERCASYKREIEKERVSLQLEKVKLRRKEKV